MGGGSDDAEDQISCKSRKGKNYYLWKFSSSLMKLLLFLVPLVVLSGFLAILGPKFSAINLEFLSSYAVSVNSSFPVVSHAKLQSVENLHPSPTVVVVPEEAVAVVGVHNDTAAPEQKKFISDGNSQSSTQELNATREMETRNGTGIAELTNNLSNNAAHQKLGFTNLERIEAGLQNARGAIKEAKNGNQSHDSEYVPIGPMYWNSKVFHRSYLEMEKQFKVFVYEEGEPPVFHNGPCKSIYSMEGNFIHRMEIDDQFRTKDPEKAHVYFLPFSVAMMVQFVYVRDSHDFGPIKRTVRDYVDLIAGKYPYWNRSIGADHFMLACHDWGPETSFSIPHLAKNSIRALCNANTSERFNPMKDVSFPEINLQTGTTEGFIGGPSPSKRSILAFFAGGLHGPIRPILLEHWENKDDDMKVHQYLPKGVSYYGMMRKSKFCLCPSGYEVASPRVVEALYTGCVPVLISDHYVAPFSDVLNWKSFSVVVPVSDIPNLKRILTGITPRHYIRMQRRVVKIRRHFEVNSPPKRYDVFHMILHSIWLRRLNVQIRDDQSSITS
ncbi:probable glycosyltransferase At5g03795 [Mercurialis annua]|uniref:probable glycosyltransferase At5g03795 n=1 Tax=Mercurialis annua TaxID=3986 RepID=UPI00215F26E8|nr:probable glycosyltransferase At5g03795 [Mercurialis annua]